MSSKVSNHFVILAAGAVVAMAVGTASANTILQVQMFPTSTVPSGGNTPAMQSGYTAFDVTTGETDSHPAQTQTISSITINVAAEGTTLYYPGPAAGGAEYNSNDSGAGAQYKNLLQTGYFGRRDVVLVLSGLSAGTYTLNTDDRGDSTSAGKIYYTLTTNTNWSYNATPSVLGSTNSFTQAGSTSSVDAGYHAGTFTFTADGTHDVILTLQSEGYGTTDVTPYNAYINGFDLSISNSSDVNLTNNTSIFDISGATSGVSIVSLGGVAGSTVILGGNTLTLTNAGGTFRGVISGTNGGLTVSGGTETLSGANTYTGVTTITVGTLALSGAGSISDSSLVNLSGATLDISQSTGGGATINNLNGSGTVALGGNTLTDNASGNYTFSGVIQDGGIGGGTGGGLTLQSSNSSSLTLSGANTYTGATTVTSGTLIIGTGGALYSSGTLGNVVDNGSLTLNNSAITKIDTLAGTGSLDIAITSTLDVTGTTTGSGVGSPSTFGGTLTGAGVLEASDSTLNLTAGNITGFTGSLVAANNGNIFVFGSSQLNSAASLNITNDNSITLGYGNLNGNALNFSGNATAGTLHVTGAALIGTLGSGSNAISILDTAGTTFNTIDGGGTNILNLAGALTSNNTGFGGSNTLTLRNGTFVLANPNNSTYFQGNGTLQIGNGSASTLAQFSSAGNLPNGSVGIFLNSSELQYTGGSSPVTVVNNITIGGNTNELDAQGGSGIVTLNGTITNALSGTLTLQNGIFNLNNTGNVVSFNTGTLQVGNGLGLPTSAIAQFSRTGDLPGAGANILLNHGELQYIGTGNVTVASNILLNPGVNNIDVHGVTQFFTGQLEDGPGGPGGLDIINTGGVAGSVVLNNIETYTGGTTVGVIASGFQNAGLTLASGGSLIPTNFLIVNNNGIFNIDNGLGQVTVDSLSGQAGGQILLTAGGLTVTNDRGRKGRQADVLPSRQTGRADFPHPAFQLMGHLHGLACWTWVVAV